MSHRQPPSAHFLVFWLVSTTIIMWFVACLVGAVLLF